MIALTIMTTDLDELTGLTRLLKTLQNNIIFTFSYFTTQYSIGTCTCMLATISFIYFVITCFVRPLDIAQPVKPVNNTSSKLLIACTNFSKISKD